MSGWEEPDSLAESRQESDPEDDDVKKVIEIKKNFIEGEYSIFTLLHLVECYLYVS